MPETKLKPPLAVYLVGILGIIPLVGAFVGFALIVIAIAFYRSWKLALVGAGGDCVDNYRIRFDDAVYAN